MSGVTKGTVTLFNQNETKEREQATDTDSLASFFWFAKESEPALLRIYGERGAYLLSVMEYDSSVYKFNVSISETDSHYSIDTTIIITWSGPLLTSDKVDIFFYSTRMASYKPLWLKPPILVHLNGHLQLRLPLPENRIISA